MEITLTYLAKNDEHSNDHFIIWMPGLICDKNISDHFDRIWTPLSACNGACQYDGHYWDYSTGTWSLNCHCNSHKEWEPHFSDVIMRAMASHRRLDCLLMRTSKISSASLAFVRGIHRWPVDSPHKGTTTRKMFPFDDVIMVDGIYGSHIFKGAYLKTRHQ